MVTIELETVREPDYAVGQATRERVGKGGKGGSRERDEIELEDEESKTASDTKARDLEESDIGAAVEVDGRPELGEDLGRKVSFDEQVAESRSRQRRSWDAGVAVRRRHGEALRKEEEDAFGRQL